MFGFPMLGIEEKKLKIVIMSYDNTGSQGRYWIVHNKIEIKLFYLYSIYINSINIEQCLYCL